MFVIEETAVAGIPSLIIVDQDKANKPLPLVIFWHGWTSGKESNLRYAFLAAKKGFRVILPDATGHGDRVHEKSENERKYGFWQVVLQNVQETKLIKDELELKELILDGRIALAGSSMGAITTFACMRAYEWIKVGVSLMGTPTLKDYADLILSEFKKNEVKVPFTQEQIQSLFKDLAPYDLGQAPETLGNRPLLFWHGMKDPVVPFDQDFNFYQNLKEDGYSNIRFIKDANAGHKVSREGLFAFADWLNKYL